MKIKLDDSDRAILGCLQKNASTSIDELAELAQLSSASVQRRLKRLRDNNVISQEVAIIDQDAVDQSMTFIIMVELERERLDQLQSFREIANKEPQVQQSYYVTGEADFILICLAKDMAEFEQLTHRLFFDNNNIRRFRTSVVMGRSKVGLTVPVWPNEASD